MELADTPRATPRATLHRTKLAPSARAGVAAATVDTMILPASSAILIVECVSLTVASHFLPVSNVRLPSVGHDVQSAWPAAYTADPALWGASGARWTIPESGVISRPHEGASSR